MWLDKETEKAAVSGRKGALEMNEDQYLQGYSSQ